MRKRSYYKGYSKPVPENLRIISFVNDKDETRFSIIDTDTGAVFDDAQGYGYKSAQNAYKALTYKSRSKEEFAKEHNIKIAVREFCKSHKSLMCDIDDAFLISAKEGIPVSNKEIEDMIPDDVKKEMSFSVKDLLKYR